MADAYFPKGYISKPEIRQSKQKVHKDTLFGNFVLIWMSLSLLQWHQVPGYRVTKCDNNPIGQTGPGQFGV